MIIHWLNTELWGPVWPNLLASAICSAAVYIRLRIEAAERHKELKRHVTAMVTAPDKESGAKCVGG